MAGLDLAALAATFYGDALNGAQRQLDRGSAILIARVGDAERAFVAQLDRPKLVVDGALYSSRDAVREELLRNFASALLGHAPLSDLAAQTQAGDRARLAIASAYGRRSAQVVDFLVGASTRRVVGLGLEIAEVFGDAAANEILVVFDAHRLETDARWDLREYPGPLLLVTRPGHLDSLVAADAPFYGHAQTIDLRAPGTPDWGRTLDRLGARVHPSDLDWLLVRSRGRVATTYEALCRTSSRRSLRAAWLSAVSESIPRAHDTVALASAVHRFAPRLLAAIAQGEAPYPAVPEASNEQVALALRKLHGLDLIEQPATRVWQLADPLLEQALVSMIRRDRVVEIAAEIREG